MESTQSRFFIGSGLVMESRPDNKKNYCICFPKNINHKKEKPSLRTLLLIDLSISLHSSRDDDFNKKEKPLLISLSKIIFKACYASTGCSLAAKYLSASSAAIQPEPAAVTACL